MRYSFKAVKPLSRWRSRRGVSVQSFRSPVAEIFPWVEEISANSCKFCCWDICIRWGEFWRTPTNANSCLPCTGLTSRGTACLFCPRLGSEFLLLTIVRLKRERSRLDLKLPPIYFLPVKCEAFEVWWFLRFETFSVIVLIGVDLMFPAVLNMGIAIQRLQR